MVYVFYECLRYLLQCLALMMVYVYVSGWWSDRPQGWFEPYSPAPCLCARPDPVCQSAPQPPCRP